MFARDSTGKPVSGQIHLNPVSDGQECDVSTGAEDLEEEVSRVSLTKGRADKRGSVLKNLIQTHKLTESITRQNYIILLVVMLLLVFSVATFTINMLANEMTKETKSQDGALLEKSSGRIVKTTPAYDVMPNDNNGPSLTADTFFAMEEVTVLTASVMAKVKITARLVLPCPSVGRDDAWSVYCHHQFVYLAYSDSPFVLYAKEVLSSSGANTTRRSIKFSTVDDEDFLSAVTGKDRANFLTGSESELQSSGHRHLMTHNSAQYQVGVWYCEWRQAYHQAKYSNTNWHGTQDENGNWEVDGHWGRSSADQSSVLGLNTNWDTISKAVSFVSDMTESHTDSCFVCDTHIEDTVTITYPSITLDGQSPPYGENSHVTAIMPKWYRSTQEWVDNCACALEGWTLSVSRDVSGTVHRQWNDAVVNPDSATGFKGTLRCEPTVGNGIMEDITWSSWMGHSQQNIFMQSSTGDWKSFDQKNIDEWTPNAATMSCRFYGNACTQDSDCCGAMTCHDSGYCDGEWHGTSSFAYAYMGYGQCTNTPLYSGAVSTPTQCAGLCDAEPKCAAWSLGSSMECRLFDDQCYSDMEVENVQDGCLTRNGVKDQNTYHQIDTCPMFVHMDIDPQDPDKAVLPVQDQNHGCEGGNLPWHRAYEHDEKSIMKDYGDEDGEAELRVDFTDYRYWGVGWECNDLDFDESYSSYRKMCIPAAHECWDGVSTDLSGNELTLGKCCGTLRCLPQPDGVNRCTVAGYTALGPGMCARPTEGFTLNPGSQGQNDQVEEIFTGQLTNDGNSWWGFPVEDLVGVLTMDPIGSNNVETCAHLCDTTDGTGFSVGFECKAFSYTPYLQSVTSIEGEHPHDIDAYGEWGCLECYTCMLYFDFPGDAATCDLHLRQQQVEDASSTREHPALYHSYSTFIKKSF
mmetsp:Transcript_10828/g.12733  ORF Transcript_10828/g.12733 Transcript_10828/m.12733 type:complete len:913 (-) Transcript_10828:123-2861(-)|eukprot:CAMPEP_0197846206 /NCGR_PEP_ID=MMETSP1438-20131217/2989_1 /TAXON_ID=1461541 /ORGANISM="Pterosperma sp., Strain CCMP1384" /LENGTH=912 /DNA_ID=CAMNT_0043457769 /DNA_START=175 /DNA_END=2913 /DNA_ORIENTATION=-